MESRVVDACAALPKYVREWMDRHPPAGDRSTGQAGGPDGASTEIDRFRAAMRRFEETAPALPYQTQSECAGCGQVVPGRFAFADGFVVLEKDCPRCGSSREAHQDAIFAQAAAGPSEAEARTLTGTPIRPVVRGLPRTVRTLCPECCAILLGRYFIKGKAVHIEKTCPEHGYFQDKIHSNADLFLRCAQWSFDEGKGLLNPRVTGAAHCPSDCGLCNQHQSVAVLAQIDLTNRCNLTCPICFANANVSGFVCEPSFEQVVEMLQQLLDSRPTPCTSVQFSGGEPTEHPRFHEIIAKARDMGFTNIQIATNGIRHADLEFARKSRQAGLHTLYLQFDGLDDSLYRRIRGRSLLEIKRQAVANCREVGLKICLVPTIVKGQNDDQVGPIIEFAVENIDVISGISFQPVCFTGRISRQDLAQKRYTLGDLADDIARATGADLERDFWPLSVIAPLCDLLSAVERKPKIKPSCHPDCAEGTYFFVAPRKYAGQPARERLTPLPRVFDIGGLFVHMKDLAGRLARKKRIGVWDKLRIFWMFRKHFNRRGAPEGLTMLKWMRSLQGMLDKTKSRGPQQAKHYKTLMCAGMHFMDRYNYDAERVRRCVIHYSTPQGVFPFCTYNSGPCYREFVERMSGIAKVGSGGQRM
jgi:uncharacterized radical SAM superfamily Fe-S cluster-containing enzyme